MTWQTLGCLVALRPPQLEFWNVYKVGRTSDTPVMLCQGCEDCTTVVATFKLLEGFEGVLERPVIASDLHRNHLRLLSAYAADLGEVSTFKPKRNCYLHPHQHLHLYLHALPTSAYGCTHCP